MSTESAAERVIAMAEKFGVMVEQYGAMISQAMGLVSKVPSAPAPTRPASIAPAHTRTTRKTRGNGAAHGDDPIDPTATYTVEETALLLGIDAKSVVVYVSKGKIRAERDGDRMMFRGDAILERRAAKRGGDAESAA